MRIYIFLVMLTVIGACGDGNGSGLRERLRVAAADFQGQVDFPLLLPDYLPAGTNEGGVYDFDGSNATIWFPARSRDGFSLAENADVDITQHGRRQEDCPPTYDRGWEVVDIAGHEAVVGGGASGQSAGITMNACTDGGAIRVTVSWSDDEEITMTDDMKEEANRVFESILEDW